MKKVITIIIILLLGVGILSYPTISNYINKKNGSFAIQEYATALKDLDESAINTEWDKAVQYNESLAGQPVHDPFIKGSGMAMQDNYNEVLVLNETMGYVTVPKISVELPIYHGTSNEVLQKSIGHLEGSSMPVGGEGTHSVLTGHTGLAHAKIFTDLTELKEGDLFFIRVLNETLAYKVDQIKVINPDTTDDLRRIDKRDYCTLLTCTPYAINSHRLLVRGERTEYIPEEKASIKANNVITDKDYDLVLVALIAIIIVLIAVLIAHKKNLKRQEDDDRTRWDE